MEQTSKKAGRPPKERPGRCVQYRLPAETIAEVKAEALRRGCDANDIIRIAADKFVSPEAKAFARHARAHTTAADRRTAETATVR